MIFCFRNQEQLNEFENYPILLILIRM